MFLIFFLALLLRVGHVVSMRSSPLFDQPIMDMAEHDNWAKQLASGKWLGDGAYFRAPGYPYFLGTLYSLFGHSYLVPRLTQALIGSMTCLLIFWLGCRFFDESVGFLAMAMSAFYWPLIFFDGELLLTSLALFLNMLVLLALSYALQKGEKYWLFCGLAFGLAATTRPNILLFGLMIGLWLLHGSYKKVRPWKEPILLLLGTVLLIAPITLRNYYVSGDAVLIAWQGGVNFYIGNNPYSDGHTAIVPGTRADWQGGYEDTISIAMKEMGRKLLPSEISWYWFKKGMKFIIDEPIVFLKLFLKKTTMFIMAPEIPNNLSLYFFRQFSRPLSWPLLGYSLVGPLGIAGMFLFWKERQTSWPLFVYYFTYSLSIILFFVCARYRIQVIPILLIYGAAFLIKLNETTRRRTFLLVFLAVFAIINCPWLWYEGHLPEKDLYSHITLGNAYVKKSQWAAARRAYEKAVSIGTDEPGPFVNLAFVCLRLKDKKSALRYADEASRRDDNEKYGGMIARIRTMAK